jgi:hypothetical protein
MFLVCLIKRFCFSFQESKDGCESELTSAAAAASSDVAPMDVADPEPPPPSI